MIDTNLINMLLTKKDAQQPTTTTNPALGPQNNTMVTKNSNGQQGVQQPTATTNRALGPLNNTGVQQPTATTKPFSERNGLDMIMPAVNFINRFGSDIGTYMSRGVGGAAELVDKATGQQPSLFVRNLASVPVPQNTLDKVVGNLGAGAFTLPIGGAIGKAAGPLLKLGSRGSSVLSGAISGAGTGAVLNPDQPEYGAVEGGLTGALGVHAGHTLASLFGKVTGRVGKIASNMISRMTNGNVLGDAKKYLSNLLRGNYLKNLFKAKSLYDNALTSAYQEGNGAIPNVNNLSKAYGDLSDEDIKKIPSDVRQIVENHINQDTAIDPETGVAIENSHDLNELHRLQSELGNTASDFNAWNASPENKITSGHISGLRRALNKDISGTLDKGSAGQLYQNAKNYFRDSVIPYRSLLGRYAGEDEGTFNTVANKFQNGDLDGISNSVIAKVIQDGGDQLKDAIIAASLQNAAEMGGINVPTLLKTFGRLDAKGLHNYVTDATKADINTLRKAVNEEGQLSKVSALGKKGAKLGLLGIAGVDVLNHYRNHTIN